MRYLKLVNCSTPPGRGREFAGGDADFRAEAEFAAIGRTASRRCSTIAESTSLRNPAVLSSFGHDASVWCEPCRDMAIAPSTQSTTLAAMMASRYRCPNLTEAAFTRASIRCTASFAAHFAAGIDQHSTSG